MVNMLMSLVKPGVGDTRARSAWPESMFSREDLPTLERPMKANSGSDSSGQDSRSGALRSKMADEMCMIENGLTSVAANWADGYSYFWEARASRRICAVVNFDSLSAGLGLVRCSG